MARHDYVLSSHRIVTDEVIDPDDHIVHVDGVLRLKRKDEDGNWDPNGSYTSASLLLETWRPTALTELTGFIGVVTEDPAVGDVVLFRLSADAGATPLFWDGAAWREPADDTEWNTETEIDTGISSFPMEQSLSVLVRLVSGTGGSTPILHSYHVFWECNYDPSEDLIRGLHAKIVDEVMVLAEFEDNLDEPSSEIVVQSPLWLVDDPVRVFNRTEDPGLREDLLASRVETTLQLSSSQQGRMLVRYNGRLNAAHVFTDPDFEVAVLPAVVLENTAQARVRDHLLLEFEEELRSKDVVRLRCPPARHDYTVQVRCVAQYPLHDKKLADAVRRVFDTRQFVRSPALDEPFTLSGLELVNQAARGQDQMFMRTINVKVSVLEWLPDYRDVPMARSILHRVRTSGVSRISDTE